MAGSGPLNPVDVIIGKLAVEQKLVDEGQLAEARMLLSMDSDKALAQVLYSLGYISIQQAERLEHAAHVLRAREEDKLLCELAVKRKIITVAQAEEVLQVQKNGARNPGQIPRVKELLVNREYVKGPMIDILMDLVQQVSPYSKTEKTEPPPKPPPGGAAKKEETDRIEKPVVSTPRKEEGPVRPSGSFPTIPTTGGDPLGRDGGKSSTPPSVASDRPAGFSSAADRIAQLRKGSPAERPSDPSLPAYRPAKSLEKGFEKPIEASDITPGRPEAKSDTKTSHAPPGTPGQKPADPKPDTRTSYPPKPGDPVAPRPAGDRIATGAMFTRAVHAGHTPECEPTIDPIIPSVTYDFRTMEELEDFLKGKPGYWYSRHGNPTVRAAEEKIAALEGSEDALLCSSGLGALTATLLTLLKPGDTIALTDGLYGGTWHLLNDVLADFNITVRRVPPKDWLLIREHLIGTTKLIYFEPITNPMLRLWDPRPAVADAKRFGIQTMVDNTFATPLNFRPIEHGIDLVFHSATKYLNGHSDVTAGVVCGKKDLIGRIREKAKLLGPTLSAFDAWLLIRGLKTFPLRMRAHNENAAHIARSLEGHPKIKKVVYPSLESHPDRVLAKWMLPQGAGGVVTFEVDGGLPAAKAFANRLKLCHRAVSLGGVESLVSLPVLSSHYQVPNVELERQGITQGAVRLSVGIEDAEDILADLKQALG